MSSDPVTTGSRVEQTSLRFRTLAASLGAATIVGAAWLAISSVNSFETSIGAVASLPIEDGSKVTLNTDSRIKVALSETERRIELKQGEAFFEVAKDPTRPFVVDVGHKRVVALGTSFSVRKGTDKTADDIQVVVTDGAVRIEIPEDNSAPESGESRLNAGDIASTAGKRMMVARQKLREAQESLSWRNGILVFRDISLAHAAAEFNRYNKRKIVIDDPGIAALTIAGSFRSTNVDSFVEVIEKGYPVRVNGQAGRFVISAEHAVSGREN